MKYEIIDISYRLGYYSQPWDTTVILKHIPGWFRRLFGTKAFTRTYFSETGIIWKCLETKKRHVSDSIQNLLEDILHFAPQHRADIQKRKEKERLVEELKKIEEIKRQEDIILQKELNSSRFDNIEIS
jgi:hypothetical protein